MIDPNILVQVLPVHIVMAGLLVVDTLNNISKLNTWNVLKQNY